jgi:hypothetical protein
MARRLLVHINQARKWSFVARPTRQPRRRRSLPRFRQRASPKTPRARGRLPHIGRPRLDRGILRRTFGNRRGEEIIPVPMVWIRTDTTLEAFHTPRAP